MNTVNLIGRLTRDPDIRHTQSGHTVARFTLAVNAGRDREANFIPCQAWDKTAEVIEKYITKGRQIGVVGSLKSGKYEKDGQTVHTLDVNVTEVHFCGSRSDAEGTGSPQERTQTHTRTNTAPQRQKPVQRPQDPLDGFMNMHDDIDEELPFV